MARLGTLFQDRSSDKWQALIQKAYVYNKWFTTENINASFEALAESFLEKAKLEKWLANYSIPEEPNERKTVAIVMAGNIPMVGFHDLLCVFMAGHKAQIKLSDKDKILIPFVIALLEDIDATTANYFDIVEKLSDFDAVIATGSDNTSRYFEAYFSKYPHIIRKNRNSIAVLTGEESKEDLIELGKDVFRYFGLGCRNVSKIYVPEGYTFEPLLEAFHEYREIQHHDKYKNNFDYNYTLYILNQIVYKANGCIIMTEDKAIVSRIACLHYEFYNNTNTLEKELSSLSAKIQCIVSGPGTFSMETVDFGKAQKPGLKDYADGADTMAFLTEQLN